jgi:hypothetical protein
MWLIAHVNGMLPPESVRAHARPEWADKMPFELGTEIFRRVVAHPEGVEIARQDETNLVDHISFADKKIRLCPSRSCRSFAARSRRARRRSGVPARHGGGAPHALDGATRSSAIRPGGRARARTARSTCRPADATRSASATATRSACRRTVAA